MKNFTMTEAEYAAHQQRVGGNVPFAAVAPAPTQIIRQSRRGMNKTETRFLNEVLNVCKHEGRIDEIGDHESITLKLANGLRYTPDFPTWRDGKLTFYEVKGAHVREDSLIKLKMAASKYPQFRFSLFKWSKGMWIIQEVLP